MKKILLLACCSFSVGVWASCEDLNRIADKKGIHYGTEYSFVVKGPKGHRAYFHSAPANKDTLCIIMCIIFFCYFKKYIKSISWGVVWYWIYLPRFLKTYKQFKSL